VANETLANETCEETAMPLQHLQHFLIQTEDLEKTKDWYVDVLGMRVGPHPDFKFPVYWLYLGDTDVLHLTVGGKDVSENRMKYLGQQSTATSGSGVVDHVAFRATGLLDLIVHLRRKGVDFKERRVNDQGLYQLFLIDPNGVKVELNFEAAEAGGREPELMASALPA
jgi:catechol 2,3-dioxygenase-like lactoylglutathione lyase family enzyme